MNANADAQDFSAGPRAPVPARRRRWPLALALLALLVAGVLAFAWHSVEALGTLPVNIVIDGESVAEGVDLAGLALPEKLALVAAIALALLIVLVVLPVALLTGLASVLLVLLMVVGLPLMAALAVLALVLSPLLLVVWLLWRLLRPSPTIPA